MCVVLVSIKIYSTRFVYNFYYSTPIRLSVCLSHSGIMSKRGDAEGCSLYHRVVQCLRFSDTKNGWWGMTLSR